MPSLTRFRICTGYSSCPDRGTAADGNLKRLPVARAVWLPNPDLATAPGTWIYAGGAHHTGFSQSLTTENLQDFADMTEVECLCIDKGTQLRHFRNELRWNAAAYS